MVADTLSGDSLVLMSSCSPLLKVDSTCNLLQTNRKWWMRQDVTPMIMLWLWLCCVTQESISTADPLQRVSSLASWKGWPLLLLSRFSRVRPLATPWTEAYQAPESMGFSRREYWSGLPLPSPESQMRFQETEINQEPLSFQVSLPSCESTVSPLVSIKRQSHNSL